MNEAKLIAEVAVLTEMVRVLSDRIAQMDTEQEQGEPLEYWNAVEGWVKIDEVREHFDSVSCATIYKNGGEGRVPLCLAQPQQEQGEPVAYFNPQVKGGFYWAKPTKITAPVTVSVEPMPLYTTPQQRTWVGLTDDEIWEAYMKALPALDCSTDELYAISRTVEAKLKEKNT
jgi:hypothetical protein